MGRIVGAAVVGVLMLVAPAAQAQEVPVRDSVSGAVQTEPPTKFQAAFTWNLSATSGPKGEDPQGYAEVFPTAFPWFPPDAGPVGCLAVSGNRAVIGVDTTTGVDMEIGVVDAGPGGVGDTIVRRFSQERPDCVLTDFEAPRLPIARGDIVVRDAPAFPTTKEQCKDGGWRRYGIFKNHGHCVSYVATGGGSVPTGRGDGRPVELIQVA